MFVTKSERFQELQSALALREQEVSQLVARKAELLDQQRSARINNGRSASSHASSEDPAAMFTIDHPVFAWCNGADAVWDLPVEQIGNVIAQLDAGIASLRLKTRNAVRESEHVAHRQRVIGSQEEKLEVAIKVLAESTGLPTNSSNQQGVQTKRLQSAPVGAFLRPDNEDAPTVRKLIVRATKESRLAESVHHATLKTIDQLNKTISKQDDTHQKINETRNRIRCAERDLEGKKRLLEDLLVEHETLDKQLSIAMRPTSDHRTRLILDRDVADLKRQVEDCVEGERRVQDRVIKAQEYRILQLEKRLVSVKRALQFHTLTDKVEAAILHLMSDATHSNNAAEDVDLGNRETLYDIDRIVPPQELVHPALYSLLASEKDKLAVVVSQQEAVIREKDQNVDALALEVASLTLGLDEAQTLLDMTTSQIALEEDEQRDAVVDDVLRQRQHYKQLLADKCHLRRDMIQQWSERHSKKDGTPSSRSSLSPHPAGDEHSECDKSPRSAPLERELSTRRSSSNRVRFVDPHDEASDEPQTNALCETQRPESTA